MKKILFIVCACIAMTFASCGRCSHSQHVDQDTLVVDDTVVVEQFDTLFVEE